MIYIFIPVYDITLKRVLMEPGKELSPSQMKKIVQTTAAKNPLYLKVLLNVSAVKVALGVSPQFFSI